MNCTLGKKDMNFNGRLLRLGFGERVAALRFDRKASTRRHIVVLLFCGHAGSEAAFTVVRSMRYLWKVSRVTLTGRPDFLFSRRMRNLSWRSIILMICSFLRSSRESGAAPWRAFERSDAFELLRFYNFLRKVDFFVVAEGYPCKDTCWESGLESSSSIIDCD